MNIKMSNATKMVYYDDDAVFCALEDIFYQDNDIFNNYSHYTIAETKETGENIEQGKVTLHLIDNPFYEKELSLTIVANKKSRELHYTLDC